MNITCGRMHMYVGKFPMHRRILKKQIILEMFRRYLAIGGKNRWHSGQEKLIIPENWRLGKHTGPVLKKFGLVVYRDRKMKS